MTTIKQKWATSDTKIIESELRKNNRNVKNSRPYSKRLWGTGYGR